MNAGPVCQPPYQSKKLKQLTGLNRNLTLRIANGRELTVLAVRHDKVGRLSDVETLYMGALPLLVPAWLALDEGLASNRKLRMEQKTKDKHTG